MLGRIVDSISWQKVAKSFAEANIDPLRWMDEPLCRIVGFFFMGDPHSMTVEEATQRARERNKLIKAQRDEEGERWRYH